MDHLDWVKILQGYLAAVNLFGFAAMAIDKGKAKQGAWRISEKSLLTLAAAGGSLGLLLGMHTFRHKTKKLKFALGIPVILCIQVLAAVFVLSYF
jgi:uncharacterized membrane protein YsdA (DUF1294 family)